MPLEAADVGFGRGIRTTPNAGDPGSCIDTFLALIGNAAEIDTDEISLTWRFISRAAVNGNLGMVKHTDINGTARRFETSVNVTAGNFQVLVYVDTGSGLTLLHDFIADVADTAEHSLGWSYDAADSKVYYDGVLANTLASPGPPIPAAADDYIWLQSGPVPVTAGQEFDLGELAYMGAVVAASQFASWHLSGVD